MSNDGNRYLRKRDGDPFVYIYTEALWERGDMVECEGPGGAPAPDAPVVLDALAALPSASEDPLL
jgi:hypothetical protein